MLRIIQYQETLIDYDSPQLIVASDQFNVSYLCLVVECTEQVDKFLCVPISDSRLKAFYQESVALRDIYEKSESEELFYADVSGEIKDVQLIPITQKSLPDDWLPERDFYFKKDNVSDKILESRLISRLSKEQIQDLLDLLKYKPLLELLSQQQKMA